MNKIQGKICPKCGTINPQNQVSCINCGKILPTNEKQKGSLKNQNKKNHKFNLLIIGIIGATVIFMIFYGLRSNGNLQESLTSLGKQELNYYDKDHKIIKKQYIGVRSYPYNKKNNVPSKLEKIMVYPNKRELQKATVESFDNDYKLHPQRRGIEVDGHQSEKMKLTAIWFTGRFIFNNGEYYIDYITLKNNTGKCIVSNDPRIHSFSVYHVW